MSEHGQPQRVTTFRSSDALRARIEAKMTETGFDRSEVIRKSIRAGIHTVKKPKSRKQ